MTFYQPLMVPSGIRDAHEKIMRFVLEQAMERATMSEEQKDLGRLSDRVADVHDGDDAVLEALDENADTDELQRLRTKKSLERRGMVADDGDDLPPPPAAA